MTFTLATQLACDVIFEDRGRNVAQTRLHFSSSASLPDIAAVLDDLMPILADLSDARIGRINFTATWEPDSLPTTTETDIQRTLALFYTNEMGDAQERLDIPSPKASLFETEGDFAGIRLAVDETLQTMLEDLVSFLVTPEGDPFPPIYDIGGLSL